MRSIRSRLQVLRDEKAAREHQVPDDPGLLGEMMDDLGRGGAMYKPTNYWAFYEKTFLPELRRLGLKDFRRRRRSILGSFSAVEEPLEGSVRLPISDAATRTVNSLLRKLRPFVKLEADYTPKLIRYFHQHVEKKFDRLGWDLKSIPANRIGNPELQEMDGQSWSIEHLQFCSMLADAAVTIPFSNSTVMCELGAGMGRQVEVVAGLFPGATILVFDIPPQLYVSNQYLKRLYGYRVLGYREARGLTPSSGSVPPEARGKILMLPTWKMPEWADTPISVFWNSASFQEMEPDVVANYLSLVRRMRPEWIYINAEPEGNRAQWGLGGGGTKEPVLANHYLDALRAEFDLIQTYRTDYLLMAEVYYLSYIFRRAHPTNGNG